ncbi:MAG: ABC transporter ATP-binding protein [Planctomycetota bacterium]
MNATAVDVRHLTCRYAGRETHAVDDVSFTCDVGQTLALVGPNGGGKTTLFRVLATLLPPTSGTAAVLGFDVHTDRDAVRSKLGVVFQNPALDKELTARENLAYHARLAGIDRRDANAAADAWLERVALADRGADVVKTLSGGMRRRLEIARSLLAEPDVLLMDEPTVGLDPGARRDVWKLVRHLRESSGRPMTVVVSTHLLDDLAADAADADRIVLIDAGRVVADDTPDALRQRATGDVVRLAPRDPAMLADLAERLRPHGDVTNGDGALTLRVPDGQTVLSSLMASDDLPPMRECSVSAATLDDVFMSLTGRGLSSDC